MPMERICVNGCPFSPSGRLGFEVSQRAAAREGRSGVVPVGVVDSGDVSEAGEGDLLDEGDAAGVLVGGLR